MKIHKDKYKKSYWEKYAQLVFPLCGINGEFEHVDVMPKGKKGDFSGPDWWNIKDDIGIEIVEVKTEEEGQIRDALGQCWGKEMTAEEVKSNPKVRYCNVDERIIGSKPFIFYTDLSGDFNDTKKINDVLKIISGKSDKSKNYKKFKKQGLFLFMHYGNNSDLVMELLKNNIAMISKENHKFDFFIFNFENITYTLEDNKIQRFDITEHMATIKQEALSYESKLQR